LSPDGSSSPTEVEESTRALVGGPSRDAGSRDGDVLVSVGHPERDKAPNYVAALERAGVPPNRIRVVTPDRPGKGTDYRDLVAESAGLVLAGGEDVEPARYGESEIPEAEIDVLPERDEMEMELLGGARDARTPVWGVCRGVQVLNVFFGGTLWQDLALQLPTQVLHQMSNPDDALIHTIRVEDPRVTLGKLLRQEAPLVNSRHHQGIKDLGTGLVPVGHAPDGLVEAVFLDAPDGDDWWVRGVQWHPENLVAMAQQRALWVAFAQKIGFGLTKPN
jgi:putative glutamine amidotransferase